MTFSNTLNIKRIIYENNKRNIRVIMGDKMIAKVDLPLSANLLDTPILK